MKRMERRSNEKKGESFENAIVCWVNGVVVCLEGELKKRRVRKNVAIVTVTVHPPAEL